MTDLLLAFGLDAGIPGQVNTDSRHPVRSTPAGTERSRSSPSRNPRSRSYWPPSLTSSGGQNLTTPGGDAAEKYYAQVSPDPLARENPDVIVYTYLNDTGRQNTLEYLKAAFANTAEVKSGRLVPTPEAAYGGRLRSVTGVATMARQLHPDAF